MVNFAHTDAGCNWQGVAGQIFDASGNPVSNYILKITGTYNGAPFNQIGITGMVAGNPYGVGGYEIVLGNKAIASVDLLTIQVFDSKGNPVTNPLPFSTSASCSQNLVLINFKAK
jgi:protocatechuate 3,4-dioxygenase beta subunit